MIDVVFTLDYEIYGNGEGSLRELVLHPTGHLAHVFQEFNAPLVVFAEAVELARIERAGADPDASGVRVQLRELRAAGHEIGLHVHPWWANATFEGGRWRLDWRERTICSLEPSRVNDIISGAIRYLRDSLCDQSFTPVSFRSGLWAMQPTPVIAGVLARQGVRVDSSLFKGGRIHALDLDYRPALTNGGCWRFSTDVNVPDPKGVLWEIPIYSQMVPFWQMLGSKRVKVHRRTPRVLRTPLPRRWADFFRFHYPRKLDFCRMTFTELRDALHGILERRKHRQRECGPIVAIGHSKDFVDPQAISRFLRFLRSERVRVTTFSRLLASDPTFSL